MHAVTKQTPLPFFVALMLLAAAMAVPLAFAAPTVATDKSSYGPGDAIVVSGTADADTMVSIQVFDPDGARVAIAQTMSDAGGAYSATVYNFKWTDTTGTWTMKAYQGGVTAEATCTFTTTAPPTEPTTIEELETKIADLEAKVDALKGIEGPKGDTGLKGDTGAKGDTGTKGDTGATGSAGSTGPAGAKGDTGPAGTAGTAAADDSMVSYVAIVIGVIAIIIAIVAVTRKPKA